MRRTLATVAAIAVVVIAALVLRVVIAGRAALRAGDEAAARGDAASAIAGWERAARWYLPLAPHVAAARQRLDAAGADEALARVSAETRVGAGRSLPWIATALVGYALWLGGCVHFARHAIDGDDRFVRRAASASGALVLVGMIVWVVGLYNAWPAR